MAVSDERPRLVVLRCLGLGDLLTGVPALRALAAAFPEHHRVLVVPAPLHALATHLGVVDDVSHAEPLGRLDRRWRGPDVAVNLHGRGPQSHRRLAEIVPAKLLAFRHPEAPQSYGGPEWRDDEHEVHRWCRMLGHYGMTADPGRLEVPPPAVECPQVARGATLVHPGAGSPARCWPRERFAAVASLEREKGRSVVVTGGPDEVEVARFVAHQAGLPPESVLAGRVDLLGLAAAVAGAARVVSGDTGVAHLATALGTPSVVLFGPTPPDRWGPPPDRPWHRALWTGRTGDPHGMAADPGLLELGVDDVMAALDALDALPPPQQGDATEAADGWRLARAHRLLDDVSDRAGAGAPRRDPAPPAVDAGSRGAP